MAQRRTGPLTRVLIGDAQPNRWLVGPRRAVLYIEEVGTAAEVRRFVTTTVPTILTLIRSREGALKRREAAATAPNVLATVMMSPTPDVTEDHRRSRRRRQPVRLRQLAATTTPTVAARHCHYFHYSDGLRLPRRSNGSRQVFSLCKVHTRSIYS